MKTYSPEMAAARLGGNVTYVDLVKIGTYCFARAEQAISFLGDTYEPYSMAIPDFASSDGSPLDGGEIRIGAFPEPPATAGVLASLILNKLLTDEPVTIYRVWYDSNMNILDGGDGYEERFTGKVNGRPGISGEWAVINVEAHLNPWTKPWGRRITATAYPWMLRRGQQFVYLGELVRVE